MEMRGRAEGNRVLGSVTGSERTEERSFWTKILFFTLVMVFLRGWSGDPARKPSQAAGRMRFAHERD